ncbi:MAG: CubicO group peptidase (beta-lactamase class C family) [Cryomorphaceae bacterium]|jgi:CubicO group peptidase (beta-lactamase class C family)
MMNRFMSAVSIALLTMFISACATTQADNPVSATPVAFPDFSTASPRQLFDADKIAALETRMQKFVVDGDTNGIATLLVKDGQVISHTQAGVRRIMDGAPIADDTIYRIYSMTKPITGVALMALYEEGKFSLDDPVAKYIPEFKDLEVVKSFEEDGSFEVEALDRQPTMRELMSHTAGFAYGLYGSDPSNVAFMKNGVLASPDIDTFITRVAGIPLMYQPGESWFYSAAVDIQGAIIERLTGMSLGEYLQSTIFAPLGMNDTGFFVPDAKYDRFSNVFAYHPETKKFRLLPFDEARYNFFGDMAFKNGTFGMESGGGGLVSTLGDYARFCQMLANGGEFNGIRILKSETVKLMRTDVLLEKQKVSIAGTLTQVESGELGFGLDFGVFHNTGNDKGKMGDGTYFWGGAAGTWFWIDPVNNLYFIGMIQRFPQGGPEVDFRGISRDLIYDALIQD